MSPRRVPRRGHECFSDFVACVLLDLAALSKRKMIIAKGSAHSSGVRDEASVEDPTVVALGQRHERSNSTAGWGLGRTRACYKAHFLGTHHPKSHITVTKVPTGFTTTSFDSFLISKLIRKGKECTPPRPPRILTEECFGLLGVVRGPGYFF